MEAAIAVLNAHGAQQMFNTCLSVPLMEPKAGRAGSHTSEHFHGGTVALRRTGAP